MELITVFASDDEMEIEFIKCILDKHAIKYMIQNQNLQNLFGGYKPFTGFDPIAGSIKILVNEADYDACLKIIEAEEVQSDVLSEDCINENENTNTDSDNIETTKNNDNYADKRLMFFSMILSMFTFLLIPLIPNLYLIHKIRKTNKRGAFMLLLFNAFYLLFVFIVFVLYNWF